MTTPVLLSRFTPSLTSPEILEQILVQRHDLAASLVESIQESALTDAKHFRLLIGPRGIGKTHMIALVYHRIKAAMTQNPVLAQQLKIAWLREEEWGVASFLDLLVRLFRALATEYPQEYAVQLGKAVDQLFTLSPREAEHRAEALLTEFIGEQTLLILTENLGDLFSGLGNTGQKQLRAYIQNHNRITMLATAQSLFAGVKEREAPFYGFFRVDYLEPMTADEVVLMLRRIAELVHDSQLATYLQTSAGQARVKAIHHLAGGNPRLYVIFAQFLTRDSLDELVGAFMQTLDDLTPYYQARMSWISPQQRKIIEYLVDVRRSATVKEIAQQCFISQQTTSSQLKDLLEKGYVQVDAVGRESFYELREPLMRFCLEVKKQRDQPIRLFVDFLRIWYGRDELEQRYAELKAQIALSRGNRELAQFPLEYEYLSHALTTSQTETDDPRIAACLQQLIKLEKKEDWVAALRFAEKLTELRGNDEDWIEKGSLLGRLNRYEEALAAFDKAITLEPNDAGAWGKRGAALVILDRNGEALTALDQTIALDPNDAGVLSLRGAVLGNLSRYEEALTALDQAIALDPNDAGVLSLRGAVLSHLDRYEEALTTFDQVIVLDPNDAWAWIHRGAVLNHLNRHLEVLENIYQAFLRVLKLEPPDRKQLLTFLSYQLTGAIPVLVNETTSLKTAQTILATWQNLASEYSEFQVALKLLVAAVQYKQVDNDKQRQRILLSLASEERRILENLLGLSKST